MASTRYGCWFLPVNRGFNNLVHYLPQVELKAHTTIQSTVSRTKLLQIFQNDTTEKTPEIKYTFPLYDGVSVVSFKCTIGDKVILGIVKEKNQAQTEYNEAVARGESAALFEQSWEASDVFSTKIGNVPKGEKAVVEIEYVGELKHDAQLDGIRYMIPTSIAPRYGTVDSRSPSTLRSTRGGKIEIVVDVEVDEGAQIEGLSSPSHPIGMTLGRTTTQKDTFKGNRASATLSLGTAELGKDFIIVVNAQNTAIPKALLEEHPDFPNHRALMTTLVPKFSLPNIHPEIVFVVDRSGSMEGKIQTLVEALKVFLKSLPLSAKFNICSFGSHYTFLFEKSAPYDERSLQKALQDADTFDANYGGTELLNPIKETVNRRLKGVPLEIMVLTDGEIWNQQEAFDFMNEAAKDDVRLFSLGIGAGASTALVEGLARSGNGFAQFVQDNEKMDKVVVRMLKAALTPHITNYRLQVNYDSPKSATASDDDYEMIESTTTSSTKVGSDKSATDDSKPTPISLFDPNFQESDTKSSTGRYDHLTSIDPPKELQAPSEIRGLFPYSRVSAYMLLPESTEQIKSVILQGTYNDTPVQLEIQVQDIGSGKTVHQLAAKKAMLELEEGRGWLSTAKSKDGKSLKSQHEADWDRIVEREAVRLGVKFQVAGKFCSFVAVENTSQKEDKVLHVTESRSEQSTSQSAFTAMSLARMNAAGPGVSARMKMRKAAPAPTTIAFGAPQANSIQPAFSSYQTSSRRGPLAAAPPPPSAPVASFAQPSGALFGSSPTAQSFGGSFGSQPTGGLFGRAPPPQASFGNVQADTSSSQFFSNSNVSGDMDEIDVDYLEKPASSSADKEFEEQMGGLAWFRTKKKSGGLVGSLTGSKFGFGGTGAAATASAAKPPSPKPIPNTVEGKMHRIIGLQRFDGSWEASEELFKLTGIRDSSFAFANVNSKDKTVKATLLAIAWLEKVAAKDAEVWEMVVDKAKQWLANKPGIADTDGAVKQAISVFFP